MGHRRGDDGATPIVIGAIGGSEETRMTALSQISPPSLQMDRPLVIAVSRAMPALFAAWRQQALADVTFFVVLGAGARSACTVASGAGSRTPGSSERRARAQEERPAARARARGRRSGSVGLGHQQRPLQPQRGRSPPARLCPAELGDSGSTWRNIVHRDDAERLISSIEAHFRRESAAYECEFRVRHKDGHWVWLLSRGKVVERDALDTPVRMTGTHMDLTRRKSTEAEVQRSAEMLRRTGELANIGGWELDLATMRYDWTEQVFRIHEIEPGPTPRSRRRWTTTRGRAAGAARGDRGGRARRERRGTSSCRSSPPRATRAGCARRASPSARTAGRCACSARSRTSPRRRTTPSSCTGSTRS
jgi:PAS domain-containing protein